MENVISCHRHRKQFHLGGGGGGGGERNIHCDRGDLCCMYEGKILGGRAPQPPPPGSYAYAC